MEILATPIKEFEVQIFDCEDLQPIIGKIVLLFDGKKVTEGWRINKEGKGVYPYILSITKEKVYNIIAWATLNGMADILKEHYKTK